jgi:hypothetical protein
VAGIGVIFYNEFVIDSQLIVISHILIFLTSVKINSRLLGGPQLMYIIFIII